MRAKEREGVGPYGFGRRRGLRRRGGGGGEVGRREAEEVASEEKKRGGARGGGYKGGRGRVGRFADVRFFPPPKGCGILVIFITLIIRRTKKSQMSPKSDQFLMNHGKEPT